MGLNVVHYHGTHPAASVGSSWLCHRSVCLGTLALLPQTPPVIFRLHGAFGKLAPDYNFLLFFFFFGGSPAISLGFTTFG